MPRWLSPILPVLFATAAACGAPADTTIDITYDYCSPLVVVPADDASAEERDSVAHAVAMWNALGLTQLSVESDGALADAPRVPIVFRDAAIAFYGLYEDEVGEVLINRGLKEDRARSITVAHELGHVFGLLHVDHDERTSVMNPANLSVEPNNSDASALRALTACPED